MKSTILASLCMLMSVSAAQAQFKGKLNLSEEFVSSNLADAGKQLKYLATQTEATKMPRTFEKGEQQPSNTGWWTSGFYPGSLLYLYEATGDADFLALSKDKLKILEKEKYNKGTHDLGFMLFCSFGNALRLTGDSTAYVEILSTGAESLSSRFSPVTKTIRSWDHGGWKFPVIIDNMMNLEFLAQVSKITGNKKYIDIAKTHANTTMKNHFRKDYSSYHVVDYDPETGKAIAHQTAQGAFDESSWARGQAWALYGYVLMYRETKDKKYLDLARHIAKFYLNHPQLPADLIPYWDFDKDQIPADSKYYINKDLRDVSSASVVASALLELSLYTKGAEAKNYVEKSELMLKSLSSAPYKAAYQDNGGFILKHSVGSIPHNTEIDVPLTYADYYYLEALIRYGRMLKGEKIIKE